MKVQVRYYGVVSQLAECRDEDISLPAGSTLHDLIEVLEGKYGPKFGEGLFDPHKNSLLPGVAILVNGSSSPLKAELKPWDQLDFLIAIPGG